MANDLFRQARKLLTAEIAACRGIEQEEADDWVLQQVVPDQARGLEEAPTRGKRGAGV